ncbi:MAG: hypothetical protein ABEK50_03490 [bacterium]
MKLLQLTVSEGKDGEPETYVLEGDRRQSNARIVQLGIEDLCDEPVEYLDEEKRHYRSRDSGTIYNVEEVKLLDKSEAQEKKREHFTLVVNENVTEGSCRVRYS